jgi:hypothetical protein
VFEPILASVGAMVDRLGLSILTPAFVLGIAVLRSTIVNCTVD